MLLAIFYMPKIGKLKLKTSACMYQLSLVNEGVGWEWWASTKLILALINFKIEKCTSAKAMLCYASSYLQIPPNSSTQNELGDRESLFK